ncbi:DnaJ domain-containing protein [Kordiimonas pumila]|uniref:DnaJ domain-containing protein n=1 Tax=Kordiimonas pumila TaxID=2161677 RepID=A0ABV7D1A5_9PROT|nr:DnaJ domain-containing protein [Kordiimonas pumila]
MAWLVAGIILAGLLFLLLGWWSNAEVKSAKRGLLFAVIIVCLLLAMLLVMRGHTVTALIPGIYALGRVIGISKVLNNMRGNRSNKDGNGAKGTDMSRREALDILGLDEGVTNAEVNSAYRRLMSKYHPDKGGSDWMAAKLSEARKVLLKE